MRRACLWGSSATLALLDRDDADHLRAVELAHALARERRFCFITNYIEAETHALLLRKLGRRAARDWLIQGGMTVAAALSAEVEAAREIVAAYDDKDWSLCDAISFAVMQARGVTTVFTFDHHFTQFGKFRVLGAGS